MTPARLIVAGFVILLLAIGFNAWRGQANVSDNHRLAARNCVNITALARIERTQVQAQAAQSRALLAKGFTFGIPKAELPRLVAEGEATQARFLRSLDELSRSNC